MEKSRQFQEQTVLGRYFSQTAICVVSIAKTMNLANAKAGKN
jgi:hypothetical protein